ncbi:MAG: hypothetical protein LBK82_02530, partial [Planctomycetaceae bacterium]|nr:hypothetical protein [Planctomycetaceae bacterium]
MFEGSNIKEIQDAIQVFGKEGIPFVLLPKPYETNEIRISPHEYDGKENAILLDENKFIVIEKDILNNIREIITATDSKDQETVLKKFLQELLKSRYDGARTIKKELLTIQLKNAKMEPLFEGSSVKKILNPLNVFGTKTIHYSDLPESYKMENDRVFLTDYDKNTILIDKDNKLIEIKNDALNTITEIIKATDIKDQES